MPRGPILDTRWNALLSDFRRSGLTHAEFCRRRGISIHSFRKHLYQRPAPKPTHPDLPPAASGAPRFVPATPPPAPGAAPRFVPVPILPDPAPAGIHSRQPLELILSEGRRIAVAPG